MNQPGTGGKAPATLRDVARRAGVSVRTVSNVVNDYQYVAPATRARVRAVLDELGYRPNAAARTLRTGRVGMIGLVLPELDLPYFAELARAIVGAAGRADTTVVIDQTDGLAERELELLLHSPRTALFDGLVMNPLALRAADLRDAAAPIPVVLLGERVLDNAFDHVLIDNVAAAREATAHLTELGRTRIAAIGHQDSPETLTSTTRTRGYRDALAGAGLTFDPRLLRVVDRFHRADGAAAMADLLELTDRPDAVFCYNDLLAAGAIRTLLSRGLRVPEDVAVVGFDDIDEGRFSTPTLTSISPDKNEIAEHAVDTLLRRIGGEGGPARQIVAGHRLVVRESTVGR